VWQRLAVHATGHEVRQQVVAGSAPALREVLLEIRAQRSRCRASRRRGPVVVGCALEQRDRPRLEHRLVPGRQAQQLADDEHGQPPRERRSHVHAIRLEAVEQTARMGSDTRRQGRDGFRPERLADDLAQKLVTWRIHRQKGGARQREQLVHRDAARARERLPVAKGALYVGEPRDGPEVALLVPIDRHVLQQRPVDRVRVDLRSPRERVVDRLLPRLRYPTVRHPALKVTAAASSSARPA
jgi:hypothetical protein